MREVFGFLFARPSLLAGIRTVLDLGGTLVEPNQSLIPEQADRIALRADLHAIGEDFRRVIGDVDAKRFR